MANNLAEVKNYLSTNSIKNRFQDILGKRAPQFMASIVNAVANSEQLAECEPESIMAAAFLAAALDLPIDSNLGFAAIIPYRKNNKPMAQFQVMYKGFIQLAIRSGYYEAMHYTEVYEDEILNFNPVKGELLFVEDFSKCKQRTNGEKDKIAGYYAWFRLKTGFEKSIYMTVAGVEAHAKKYSKAYQYDLEKKKKSSRWTTDFEAMGKKTVIKQLLSHWGILSVDMQKAIENDQKVYDEKGEGAYLDNPETPNSEVIDIEPEETKPATEVDEEGQVEIAPSF